MWNWILSLFGLGKKKTLAEPTPVSDAATKSQVDANATPKKNPEHYRSTSHYRSKYYRRNGNYYSGDDDSLLEDLILIALLTDVFDTVDAEAAELVEEINEPETSIEDDIAAIDAAVEAERDTYVAPIPAPYVAPTPEPSYSEPEPDRSYGGGGSSYDGGGSSYDGGGSDSGGDSGGD